MDEALNQQINQKKYIDRFWENLLKVGRERLTKAYCKARLELLESYWTNFFENHLKIMSFEKVTERDYVKLDMFSSTEENYLLTKSRITERLEKFEVGSAPPGTSNVSSIIKQIQLPKINLPTFSGDQLEWERFRDLFTSLVHNAEGLAPIQKLQYLKASLTGEAAAVISNMDISTTGYATAWEELNTRYDNKRVLLATHMRTVLSAPPVSKASAAEIKRLITTINQASRSFKALKRPVEQWDDWFVHLLVEKLDSPTRLLWESSLNSSQAFPTFKEVIDFLQTRARALEAAEIRTPAAAQAHVNKPKGPKRRDIASHASSAGPDTMDTRKPSPLCNELHSIRSCDKFKAYRLDQRRDCVSKRRICYNCLGPNHPVTSCPSNKRCRYCREKHHTLLHGSEEREPQTKPELTNTATTSGGDLTASETKPAAAANDKITALAATTNNQVLLTTARVKLIAESGLSITARALLDSASEASFITERMVQLLRLPRRRVDIAVTGLQGTSTGTASHAVSVSVASYGSPSRRVAIPRVLVLTRLTSFIPGNRISVGNWKHLNGLNLADPDYEKPAQVDIILGADVYGMLLENGLRQGPPGTPSAHLTIFGWVLMGTITTSQENNGAPILVHHTITQSEIQDDLRRLWELEDIPAKRILTPEESYCEDLFRKTHYRDERGRYVVCLPQREDISMALGSSRPGALQMLQRMEYKLSKDNSLRKKYNEFMTAYKDLGHMETVPEQEISKGGCYYMPHHAVTKTADPDGKIRVVFNASFRTTTGVSLNDKLLSGPKLQSELWLILTRWRLFQFVFTTDIVKMFRQIRIHQEDANLQRVLWRAEPSLKAHDFRLRTVTYGTTSAPYLAIRTLLQLAQDEGERFPLGAKAIRNNTYVDDILTGSNTMNQTHELKAQLVQLLASGGFNLSKWASNHSILASEENQEDRLIAGTEGLSTLGILWSPQEDTMAIRAVPSLTQNTGCTKRSVLSIIARSYDPLGLAAPVLVAAKILLQDLWMAGLEWDQLLPEPLLRQWQNFATSLPLVNELSIPRWTGTTSKALVELHGFSDASSRAYAAAVYLRSKQASGQVTVSLLVAKTKVAPLGTVSIPRLELCGALLLARLLDAVVQGLELQNSPSYAWTDSMVVLAWLHAHPSRWKQFVANRVDKIQNLVPPEKWHFVSTIENPADLATRGINPNQLRNSSLWWKGPDWLSASSYTWKLEGITPAGSKEEEEEARPTLMLAAVSVPVEDNAVLLRFSSLSRLIRISALCFRFYRRLSNKESAATTQLSAQEMNECRLRWMRIAQQKDFSEEIRRLSQKQPIPPGSPLRRLRPLLDQEGLLRVGGRLQHALIPYEEKHPIILAKTNHLTLLLVREAHAKALHAGPQLTRSILLRRYWIIHANSLIRSVIHQCVRCTRFRAETAQQQMGQLPVARIQPNRPFYNSGVDYAGPLQIRTTKGRGHKSYKGYICLFVCMSTKAIHLEPVSDLSTATFLAAFKRFVARRGHCAHLMSDNGTNFRGAERELKTMFAAAADFYKECKAQLANNDTKWTFIPPSAPHFGGIWEAGVKAVKHHLRRVIGEHTLTFEELSTLLCQIEACLNSRPLYPLSNDPSDLVALTPGHLLIGETPVNVPEPSTGVENSGNIISRWTLISNMRDHFWYRWSAEYLHHLQQLPKWQRRSENLAVGSLVLVKDELQPPTKWALARIIALRPGADGLVRVVHLKTATTSLIRPITKICPLPIPISDEQQGNHLN